MKITEFSVKRPIFTLVTMALIIILGAVSLFKIPVTLIPSLNPPIGVVVTSYPGASPLEVNEKVTKPLESSLATLPGIKRLQSTAQEGASLTILEFNWSTNMSTMQMEIQQRLDMAQLPDDVSKPSYMKFDPSQFPIIQLSLQAENQAVDLHELAEALEQQLQRTEGVASVNVSGKLLEEIGIELDAQKLEEKGLTQADVVQLVQASNISLPGESVVTDGLQLTTRVVSLLTSVEEIDQLIISVNPLTGESLYLSDIATVERKEQEATSITRANNDPALLISVLQQSDTNTKEVSDAFQQELAKLLEKPQYDGVTAHVLFDQGDYVKLAINNISSSLLFGGLFAMIVLFLFLRTVVSPLIVGVAIPYSVIVTFVLIYFADFSLNIMTLGALALGIGMLVDNAIVVIENIERHMAMGKTPMDAALSGTKEVSIAIIASTLTTVAVFLPVVFISGLIGQIFTQFALTIAFSLFASLAVALTVVPMLAGRLLKPKKGAKTSKKTRLYDGYHRLLKWGLHHRAIVLITTLVAVSLSSLLLYKTGTEFIPATDEGYVAVQVQLPNGTALEKTETVVTDIEQYIESYKEVDVVVSVVGANQQSMGRGTPKANEAELYVKLVSVTERDASIFELVEKMEKELVPIVKDRAEVTFNLTSSSGSTPNTLSFRVTDTNEKELQKTVEKIVDALHDIETVTNVETDLDFKVEEVQIDVLRDEARAYGLVPAQIAQTVGNMTRGMFTTQIIAEDGVVLPVMTSFGHTYTKDVAALKAMKLRTPSGLFIELQDVANITIANRATALRRSDQAAAVAFFVKYSAKESLSGISKKVDQKIADLSLSDSTRIIFSGDRELFDSAKKDMILAIALAVVLVYIVMAAQFESLKYPFVMLFSVPLMIIGVALALFITNTLLGITAIIGVLVLVGIVVNNGIVLVDYINQQKARGMSSYEAIIISCRDRLRPILMTALTTMLGLIPLALGIGEGTELNQPMAIVVIGGLFASTFLTLFIVPIIYSLMDRGTVRE